VEICLVLLLRSFRNTVISTSLGARATDPGDVTGDTLPEKSGATGAGMLTPANLYLVKLNIINKILTTELIVL
jgi:hypothetical protein